MNRSTGLLAAIALLSVSSPASSTSEPDVPVESVTIEMKSSRLDPTFPYSGELLIYDQTDHGIPVTAFYPDFMQVSARAGGEGIGVDFAFRPRRDALNGAQVRIFLPTPTTSAEKQESFVTRASELMVRNGWTHVAHRQASSSQLKEQWVQVIFDFRADQGESGHILLGDLEGHALEAILLYPDSLSEIYWPAAQTILDTLEIKTTSGASSAAASTSDAEAAADSASQRGGPD